MTANIVNLTDITNKQKEKCRDICLRSVRQRSSVKRLPTELKKSSERSSGFIEKRKGDLRSINP